MPLFKILFTYLVIIKIFEETLTHVDLKETSLSVYLPIPMKPAIIIRLICICFWPENNTLGG